MKYKLISTDIDRTFSKQERIFPENIEYMKFLKKKGVILVANTGRGLKSGIFIIKLKIFDYLIGNDGSFIYDLNKNKLIKKHLINKSKANRFLKIANMHSITWVVETMNQVYFADVPVTHSKEFLSYSDYPFKYANFVDEDVNRILLMLSSNNIKKFIDQFPFSNNLKRENFNCFHNKRTWEITSIDASKGKSLSILLDKLKIKASETLIIGDSINDISMLKLSDMSIAMKNSDPEVLLVAKYITDSEENYGWIKGVKNYE